MGGCGSMLSSATHAEFHLNGSVVRVDVGMRTWLASDWPQAGACTLASTYPPGHAWQVGRVLTQHVPSLSWPTSDLDEHHHLITG
eukprot:295072-Chlamydomonas_euryale.AAC.2